MSQNFLGYTERIQDMQEAQARTTLEIATILKRNQMVSKEESVELDKLVEVEAGEQKKLKDELADAAFFEQITSTTLSHVSQHVSSSSDEDSWRECNVYVVFYFLYIYYFFIHNKNITTQYIERAS